MEIKEMLKDLIKIIGSNVLELVMLWFVLISLPFIAYYFSFIYPKGYKKFCKIYGISEEV